ncbi:hypothetical protein M407DRAFT_33375 [Tulasnella calospora MUT 4182]|uniref:Uncharacterized protein n=1 Tax=Tulasnella calospora MUT 4182 TaxID=1051891 RepID=A0A0C3Q360_9AGAM|nr:hypothetical protein M407DRAFT_33375 [Tulasnella calospora MUT 4182]
MSSAPRVERFKGTGWEECHEFIVAIPARAFWEGKQRDSAWIADFAATLFWRKALSWHGQLPQDVRQDWFKLEAALFDRWSEPEAHDEPQINPTPAAAPSLNPNDKANHPLQGVLNYANMTPLDPETLKSTWGSNTPFQLVTCTVLANGEVIPVWKTSHSSAITLSFFVIGDSLFLVPDPGAYGRKYSGEKRAKLFIKPTD